MTSEIMIFPGKRYFIRSKIARRATTHRVMRDVKITRERVKVLTQHRLGQHRWRMFDEQTNRKLALARPRKSS